MSFIPSQYQQAVFAHVEDPTAGNAVVEAVAGSGKSKTIEEAEKRVKAQRLQSIFLAFGKDIAAELKKRGVNARTFHSLCFGNVLRVRGATTVTENKLHLILQKKCVDDDFALYASFAKRMVGLARNMGIGCLTPDTEMAWIELAAHHDIELENEEADFGRGIEIARKLLDASNRSKMVDFDDILYFAVRDGVTLPKFDFVFVDEAQDTNPVQRAILRKIMKPTSRLVAVGDPAQAIYGFRGADSGALDLLAKEFQCKRLPLSITYRCPTSVVRYAQQWVSHIEARPGAPEGKVTELGTDWKLDMFQPNDLVVCRKTAPLIVLAYRFIRERRPVTVLGRDIGTGLKSLIKKMNATGVEHLEEKLQAFQEREVQKAKARGDDSKVEAIYDKVGCILFLIEGLQEGSRHIDALNATIDSLFTDKKDAVRLCTIHKSKGLEEERVWWLNRSECPAQWARQPHQQQEEINLCYVAATRAKSELLTFELEEGE
jgi:DNA helicase-2/ATP-dependent DNA helicase PcrA